MDSSDSDEGYDWEFPPPTEKPDVLFRGMAQPQPDMPTEPDSAPNWSPVQSMYYRSNIQRTETITKQIIQIEMLREEKVAKHNTGQI